MEFSQAGDAVICVSPGIKGTWDVSEKGSEEPLASFEDKENAYAYATELTKSKEGATVLVEDEEGFSLLPRRYEGSRTWDGVVHPRDGAGR